VKSYLSHLLLIIRFKKKKKKALVIDLTSE